MIKQNTIIKNDYYERIFIKKTPFSMLRVGFLYIIFSQKSHKSDFPTSSC